MTTIPTLDLSHANNPEARPGLLQRLRSALYDVGFLYVVNHGVSGSTISNLVSRLPGLFDLPVATKQRLSKINSPHFLGYSGFAEETTLGKHDLREQFDFATELPAIWQQQQGNRDRTELTHRDMNQLYWRLRGPNQWPNEEQMPGFRETFTEYHDALQALSYHFVHLVEDAFNIPVGTFDDFFSTRGKPNRSFLPPQHRIKLLKYPPVTSTDANQGVGAHKDSSGWLTFLLQVGDSPGLEVLTRDGVWIPVPPVEGTFVVNFGNAFEAATEGAVRATVHRVLIPSANAEPRYSIPFFQGLPLDMTVSEVRSYIPTSVRQRAGQNRTSEERKVSSFLDPRWDSLGESQLRKWIRSHQDVAQRWYCEDDIDYYSR